MKIPFNRPYVGTRAAEYVQQALASRRHCGNGPFAERCIALMRERFGFGEVFLTPSGTAALEMGAVLADIGPEDEVILPSYTFSSTANAVALRGAKLIFCEVDPKTLNVDTADVAARVTSRTRMILPIDYAGIPCDVAALAATAAKANAIVMLDAAQSLDSRLPDGRACGVGVELACFSFHETKNVTCGEGGALVVNRPDWVERAHFIQEKGTDRRLVLKGVRSKYQWVDLGSSFLLSELNSAMLLAQLEEVDSITQRRGVVTTAYAEVFAPHVRQGHLTVTAPAAGARPNHHAFIVILDSEANQVRFLELLRERGVSAYIGYMPLHSSPMGRRLGYRAEDLPRTTDLAARAVRMPLFTDMTSDELGAATSATADTLRAIYG